MLAYAVALAVAVAIVPITGGKFTRLAELEFRRVWLLAGGLAIQIGLEIVHLPRSRYEDLGLALLLLSYTALLGFCASNLRTRGFVLIGIGIALNAFVIALNAGMPYRATGELPRETTVKHRPTRDPDLAVVLSDQIVIGGPVRAAISVGDLVLATGIVELAYIGSRRRRRIPKRPVRYVDLPALEREIDLRDQAGAPTASAVDRSADTTRSRAPNTRRS
jgi:Family of unknown function (DUF5317)